MSLCDARLFNKDDDIDAGKGGVGAILERDGELATPKALDPVAVGDFPPYVMVLIVVNMEVCVLRVVRSWGCQRNRTRIWPDTPATPSKGILTTRATKLSTYSLRIDIPPEPNNM